MHAKRSLRDYWPWLGWFVASAAGLYQFFLQIAPSVMIDGLGQSFSLDPLGVSLLSSSFFYTYLVCQIPAGLVIDYFQPRRTIFVNQFFLAILCIVFASASSLWVAETSRILMGFFAAPTIVAALYLVARTLPEKHFALIAGLTEMMGMLGGAVGQVLLARSVTHFGWRDSMLILAGIAVIMSLSALFFIRDQQSMEVIPAQIESRRKHIFRDLLTMFTNPAAWVNGIFCGCLFGVIAAFGAFWGIPFFMQLYGISLGHAADINAMIFVGAAFGAPVIGWTASRIGHLRLLMQIFTVASLLVFVVIVYVPVSIAMMYFLVLVLGFFTGVYLLSFTVMRDITPPHIRGAAMGFINMMCILIGPPVLQPVIGWLLHAHSELSLQAYQQSLMVIAVGLVLAFGLTFFVREKNGVG